MRQRSDEWYQARLGKVTASRIVDVMAKGKGKTRATYMNQLIAERMTREVQAGFVSEPMQRGTDLEVDAVSGYEYYFNCDVEEVGFVDHPTIKGTGSSPDRLVGTDGLAEFKCPNTSTHLRLITDRKIARPYQFQMQWQMECTGRDWCDFVSYDDRLDENLKLFVIRVDRDQEVIETIKTEVICFISELDAWEAKLLDLQAPQQLQMAG